jgi:hypothetical protein
MSCAGDWLDDWLLGDVPFGAVQKLTLETTDII